ncbi:MAG: hypothetical protein LH631_10455 [Alkalinema sp. CAN_BIN05]|nr:hypothetical protein [Alkalinema sp. CAN_BIN05]
MNSYIHWKTIMQTQSAFFVSAILLLTPLMTLPSLSTAPAQDVGYRGSGRFDGNDDYRGSGRVTI